MSITKGDKLPNASFVRMGEDGPQEITLSALTKGRKVVIFAVPGAFTPTCSSAHVPSFIRTKQDFEGKGVEEVICISVNDAFVMAEWARSLGADRAGITMLADPQSAITSAIGMDFDAPPVGLIKRSKRYAMLVEDGVVQVLNVEASPGECTISAGETLLEAL